MATLYKLLKHQQNMSRASSDTGYTQNCSDSTRDPSVIDWHWIFVLPSQGENKDKKIHKTEKNQKCRRMTDIQLANWVCHSQGYGPGGGLASWSTSNISAVVEAHVSGCHEWYTGMTLRWSEVTCKHLSATELSHWWMAKRITIEIVLFYMGLSGITGYAVPKHARKNHTRDGINEDS